MLLVDSSVWIGVIRGDIPRARFEFEQNIVVCPPVVQEVLQGIRRDLDYRFTRAALLAFPMIENPMSFAVFEEAGILYQRSRAAGYTIRSSYDCLIAACAIRHGAVLLHLDRDFEALARVSPLAVRSARV